MAAPIPLPIDEKIPEIIRALEESNSLVLIAEPGAGKTTRLPPALLNAPFVKGMVVVSQPRRIAARAAAKRVALENGWTLGKEVGYAVRGENRSSPETRLLYVTEGVLTAMLQADPFLEKVSVLVFDEFHERNIDSDLSLAFAREIMAGANPGLKVAAASATLEPGPVAAYLGARTMELPGRAHPVEVRYLPKQPDAPLEDTVARGVREMWPLRPGGRGDILVFLPGAGEIRRATEKLAPFAASAGAVIVRLHGDMSPEEQDLAIAPAGEVPRIILSTNIAETSLTIDGVTAVVDSGLARQSAFDPATGMTRLETVRIGKANAVQRSGRAGRTGPGAALRLWTKHEEEGRPEKVLPEVLRADLARALLETAAWGHANPHAFPWLTPPDPARVREAEKTLKALGALAPDGSLTQTGRAMLSIPAHPRLAKMLLEASETGLAFEGAAIAAIMGDRDILKAGRAFGGGQTALSRSDLLLRLEILEKAALRNFRDHAIEGHEISVPAARAVWEEAKRIAAQLPGKNARARKPADAETALLKLIFDAFPDRAARLDAKAGRYILADGSGARLARSSSVTGEPYLVAVRLDAGERGKNPDSLILTASGIEEEWLKTSARAARTAEHLWREERNAVEAVSKLSYGAIVLEERRIPPDPEAASALLSGRALADPEKALRPGPAVLKLIDRASFLSRALGPERFPVTGRDLLASVLPGLSMGRSSFAELREADLKKEILAHFDRDARRLLETGAPETIVLPSGREAAICYPGDGQPYVEAKMQEVFGQPRSPRLALGEIPLVFRLLGPHGRPLQITADLESFWKNGYPEVLKEMKGRYPKHYWPENPLQAQPTARTVKKKKPA